ncbi:PAS domain S-box protein [Halorubrum sp. ASP1]|uniref:PAS domain-containing sensor histidine kinase n=1 Tax=Halorubrum sp. ASP1 TaxID=2518114 RepID=UPI0010F6F47C|nr:PAS domain-containing protein [Halorubrum sp. ASP1]TKX63017.1 PAS domain S-box protein [Halorubrum sp. ASP1]
MSRQPEPETLIDLAQDKIAVIDETGRFRYLNAATHKLLGFEPNELIGTDAFELVHPEDVDRVRAAFETAVQNGIQSDATLEYRYRTADGDWLWLRTRVYPPEETGIDGWALSSRNVTAAVESRRRLETIASTSPDVLWMFTPDWSELLFVNEAISSVYGIDRETLREQPQAFVEVVHPDDRSAVLDQMKRLSAGKSINLDYRIGTSNTWTRWVRVPGQPVVEDDEVVAVTGFARDVTDEYRRKRQLTVMDNLLRHTIRNDMNIVDGTAEQIAARANDALAAAESSADLDAAALAADLLDHAETIRRVADDLLTSAEKQRGVIDLLRRREPPKPLQVDSLVETAVNNALSDCDAAAAEISVDCPDGLRALTHPELDYAITELIENAIEHATTTPRVTVEVTAPDDHVAITVQDNAPPIPADEHNPITDSWEMTDLNHTAGMGLWLVYWIADRSGGKLTFNTNADGNEVTITVPNADCDPTLPEADQIPPPETAVRPAATEPDGGTSFRSSESVFGADVPESSTDPNASHDLFSGETDD